MKCPKCGYERQPGDSHSAIECPKCGIVYAKYKPQEPQNGLKPGAEIKVKLVGIDIPFGDLVMFQVKLALASIPAIIIVSLVVIGVFVVFGIGAGFIEMLVKLSSLKH